MTAKRIETLRRRIAFRQTALFLAVWMTAPVIFRLATLIRVASRYEDWGAMLVGMAWTMLATLPQDLFVSLQVLLVVIGLQAILGFGHRKVRLRGMFWFTTAMFVVLQVYLLIDVVLNVKTGIRMNLAFLEFLPALDAFASSIWEVGVGALALGLAGIVVCMAVVVRVFRRTIPHLRFSRWLAVALPATAFLALQAKSMLPPSLCYAVDNRILATRCSR